jgi:biopolymer transport protein ExbB
MRYRNRFGAVCRRSLVVAIGLTVVVAILLGQATSARAQEPKAGAPEKAAAEEKAAPAKAAAPEEPLVVEQPTEPKEKADQTEAAKPVQRTMLEWLYHSLGIRYSVAFLFLSFAGVALLIMHLIAVRTDALVPPALVQSFESLLDQKKYQEAYDLAKGDESMLGQVLAAGLAKLSKGYAEAIEAMQEVGEEENMRLEHRLSYLALVTTISPMVGLLGTVDGMVASFNVIAESTVSPRPCDLAQGISTALVTTLIGLMIAIPAMAVHTIFRNRIARFVLQVGVISENLMSRFSNLSAKKN